MNFCGRKSYNNHGLMHESAVSKYFEFANCTLLSLPSLFRRTSYKNHAHSISRFLTWMQLALDF